MKRYIACLTLICSTMFASQSPALEKLIPFKKYLDAGNRNGMDYSRFSRLPQSRFHTFKTAFRHFEQTNGRVIVELGTSRSFVDGGYVGCNEDNPKYWEPNNPGKWDWGAGFFTYLSAHCLGHLKPEIHTVDLI